MLRIKSQIYDTRFEFNNNRQLKQVSNLFQIHIHQTDAKFEFYLFFNSEFSFSLHGIYLGTVKRSL